MPIEIDRKVKTKEPLEEKKEKKRKRTHLPKVQQTRGIGKRRIGSRKKSQHPHKLKKDELQKIKGRGEGPFKPF